METSSAGLAVPAKARGAEKALDSSSQAFIAALEKGDREGIRSAPKSDLHNHGILGMDYGRLCALLGPGRISPPPRFKGLKDFLAWTSADIQRYGRSPDWSPFLLDASCESAAAEGVKVLELSFDSGTASGFRDPAQFVALVERLFLKWAPYLRLKPEMGFRKAEDPRRLEPLIDAVIGSGLFRSIDLHGREDLPISWPSRWKPVYLRARKAGMKLKAHLGELSGPLGLLHAARTLDLDAVQHGVAFSRSRLLRDWARERDATLNLCPASNLALGACRSLKDHPIRAFFDEGIRVTINTDDLLAFGSTLSDQYLALHEAGVFSASELDRIRLNGLEEGARG